jgi:hypothetical protein
MKTSRSKGYNACNADNAKKGVNKTSRAFSYHQAVQKKFVAKGKPGKKAKSTKSRQRTESRSLGGISKYRNQFQKKPIGVVSRTSKARNVN